MWGIIAVFALYILIGPFGAFASFLTYKLSGSLYFMASLTATMYIIIQILKDKYFSVWSWFETEGATSFLFLIFSIGILYRDYKAKEIYTLAIFFSAWAGLVAGKIIWCLADRFLDYLSTRKERARS